MSGVHICPVYIKTSSNYYKTPGLLLVASFICFNNHEVIYGEIKYTEKVVHGCC